MNAKALILSAMTSLLLSASCKKEAEPEAAGCGCTGKASTTVTDRAAQLSEDGRLLLNNVDYSQVAYRELLACDKSTVAGLTASKAGEYNYRVSGELRPPCIPNGVAYFWSINITAIREQQ